MKHVITIERTVESVTTRTERGHFEIECAPEEVEQRAKMIAAAAASSAVVPIGGSWEKINEESGTRVVRGELAECRPIRDLATRYAS